MTTLARSLRPWWAGLAALLLALPAQAQIIIVPPNVAPVPQGIADGDMVTIEIGAGITSLPFSFTSPEAGQTTTITVYEEADVDPTADSFIGSYLLTTAPGNPATATLELSVSAGLGVAPGVSSFYIEAMDDGAPPATTTLELVVEVVYPPTVGCVPGAGFYFLDFDADGTPTIFADGEYVRIYSYEPGLLDLSGCSLTAWDPFSETVTYEMPFAGNPQAVFLPFTEPTFEGGVDFPEGSFPDGPGVIAVVASPAPPGTTVPQVGMAIHGIAYLDDQNVLIQGPTAGPLAPTPRRAAPPAVPIDLRAYLAAARTAEAPETLALRAWPNPASETVSVVLALPEAADLRVSVHDALGREVARLQDGPADAGRRVLSFDTSALPAGAYVVRADVGGEVQTARLTVVR